MLDDVIRPRAAGGEPGQPMTGRAATDPVGPCGSWFGVGVTVLVCGTGEPPSDAQLVVRRREGNETWLPGDARFGPGWAIQRLGAVPSAGDRIELQLPSRDDQQVLVRLAGADGQPYVTRIYGTSASGSSSFEVRDVEGVPRLVDSAGKPVGSIVAGVEAQSTMMASLRVRGRTATLRIANGPPLRRLRLRAQARRGTLPEASRIVRAGVIVSVFSALVLVGVSPALTECSSASFPSVVAGIGLLGCIGGNGVGGVAGLVLLVRGRGGHRVSRQQRRIVCVLPVGWLALVVSYAALTFACIDSIG
ncbi:hypothetical protein AB0L40_02715 [Patulibacter sp. NPDC049589]|uniref:hypothetical protein n=1 Tax=Patulibacter sp. NPDC049589 TaxID=3154731 RepID=UPI00342131A8